jgi:hypothetical protein
LGSILGVFHSKHWVTLLGVPLVLLRQEIVFILFIEPGVNVMITNFFDFADFCRKHLAFFLKTNVMIQFCHNSVFFSAKIFLKS